MTAATTILAQLIKEITATLRYSHCFCAHQAIEAAQIIYAELQKHQFLYLTAATLRYWPLTKYI
jgi:2-methylcitrate dehydratase PrpD